MKSFVVRYSSSSVIILLQSNAEELSHSRVYLVTNTQAVIVFQNVACSCQSYALSTREPSYPNVVDVSLHDILAFVVGV